MLNTNFLALACGLRRYDIKNYLRGDEGSFSAAAFIETTLQWLARAELRACCRVRATTLYERLAVLADTGRVVKTDDGYRLADS